MRFARFLAATLTAPLLVTGCTSRSPSPPPPPSPSSSPTPSSSPSADGRPTAADYAWFERNDELTVAFCFIWVESLSPAEVLKRLAARPIGKSGWRNDDYWSDSPGLRDREVVTAVTKVGNWSLIVEDNGTTAIEDDSLKRLSRATRVIANYRNVEGDGRFALVENGTIQVDFDPQDPTDRQGATPDRLLPDMAPAGLDMSESPGLDPADPAYVDVPYTEAAFALTERQTHIPFTPTLLHSATYHLGALPDPLTGNDVIDEVDPPAPS
ncbi:DUF6461 domain-containing protein [Actinoplanes sp. NPDC048796]|uniref:DUF6461 domain-containing protein n=1 Tax=Actinoplanes sp. NPDC048796 TaxID=3155640 RepID=UPI0033CBF928